MFSENWSFPTAQFEVWFSATQNQQHILSCSSPIKTASEDRCWHVRLSEMGEGAVADEVREVCKSLWCLLQFTICLEETHSTGSNVRGCVFSSVSSVQGSSGIQQKSASLMCSLNRNIVFDCGCSYLPLGSILLTF